MSQVPSGPQQTSPAPFNPAESKRVTCGVLAILLGFTGIHKFMLGKTKAGIIQILLNLVCAAGIIGLIEGIIYLTKTDEEFYNTYVIGNKEWF
jgi:TM2 domain-containing membrane protein YozV